MPEGPWPSTPILSLRAQHCRGPRKFATQICGVASDLAPDWRLLRHLVPRNDGKELLARLRGFAPRNDSNIAMKLTVDELARLFGGRTRFVERLAQSDDPLRHARGVLRALPDEEFREALNAHPRIGERPVSAIAAAEQGAENDPSVLAELSRLNSAYEAKFGFRFVVFVNRRPRTQIVSVLRARLERTRRQEVATAIDELVAIAEDRYRQLALPETRNG